jgi:hypothetical protein
LLRSLVFVAGVGYAPLGNGIYYWRGTRPPGHHAHGTFDVRREGIIDGRVDDVIIRKQRWSLPDRSSTQHSRPPDDVGRLYDALRVAVELWCWLNAALGLHAYESPIPDGPDRRTVQRWFHGTLPRATAVQSAIRRALIERSEPRPIEQLFPGGLSPPSTLSRRRWQDPDSVSRLWRGLAMLVVGAKGLNVDTAVLLAEARGRTTHPTSRSLV